MAVFTRARLTLVPAVMIAVQAVCLSLARADDAILTGPAAFGDWQTDAPGVTRRITPADLPRPFTTGSSANPSREVARLPDAALRVPPGFAVAPFATGLTGARVIRVAPNGDMFVARTRRGGAITVLRPTADGTRPAVIATFAAGLDQPFGIAFYPPGPEPRWVYIAEMTRVVRYAYQAGDLTARGPPEVIVPDLPAGGHTTRDIAFAPDGRTLFVSVGSATNVAEGAGPRPDALRADASRSVGAAWGSDEGRALVLAFDPDGAHRRIHATGIRNCSGLAVQPDTGDLYCATNERDLLGDNLPPDYVTRVAVGAFYGWPWYYIGANEDPRHAGERPDLAEHVTVPDVLLQPHSAPLAIAFDPGGQFPAGFTGDAFVALHGSWNRARHTGYKIVRLPFQSGHPTGAYQDFVTGFAVDQSSVWGRPVGVAFARDGSLLFTDDAGGTVWRVAYPVPQIGR